MLTWNTGISLYQLFFFSFTPNKIINTLMQRYLNVLLFTFIIKVISFTKLQEDKWRGHTYTFPQREFEHRRRVSSPLEFWLNRMGKCIMGKRNTPFERQNGLNTIKNTPSYPNPGRPADDYCTVQGIPVITWMLYSCCREKTSYLQKG